MKYSSRDPLGERGLRTLACSSQPSKSNNCSGDDIPNLIARTIRFRSLRSRVVLLALFASVLLIAAGASFFFFLNSSQRAKLDAAQRHLTLLVADMSSDYKAQLAHGFSLQQVRPPLPPPPPPAPPRHPPHPPQRPPDDLAPDPLTSITAAVLRRESDVEGGFYAAGADVLTGYAFPTHEGPGGTREIPGKERPEIEELARTATRTGTLQMQSFHGAYDAILFVATPVRDGDRITGAAWLMQRMPGLEAGRSKQLLVGSLGFAAAALVCALLTFFITSEVNTGVQTVLARLGVMEGALGEHPAAEKPQLAEFEQVLQRVDALSDSLKQKIEVQRALEDEMRHHQRLSALGQFAAGVAHELRNPLATIRLRTQMSQRAEDTATVERNSTVVLTEVDRLNSMIERLLYFSRPIHLHMARVPLGELCRDVMGDWKARHDGTSARVTCSVADALMVVCDRGKLRQAIENLLDNALHSVLLAERSAPEIQIRGEQEGSSTLLSIVDNGIGLDQEAETRALEPFFTTKDIGTGLGLSICYEIVQAHGGDLRIRNGAGGGAVATIVLPMDDGQTPGRVGRQA